MYASVLGSPGRVKMVSVAEYSTSTPFRRPSSSETSAVKPGMPELVIGGPFPRVGQGLIGFLDFLEVAFRVRVPGIAVRMILHGEAAVGLLQIGVGSSPLDTEHLVVIAFRHA
jgi:hypothetical protein